jgi:hypothetical protein
MRLADDKVYIHAPLSRLWRRYTVCTSFMINSFYVVIIVNVVAELVSEPKGVPEQLRAHIKMLHFLEFGVFGFI